MSDKPVGIIVGDEYTKTFKGANTKAYLSDNMEDLSRLADCDLGKVGTISRGVEYPEHAYVSFASASTYYMLTLMGDEFFIQGTGNRILWIVDEKREEVDVEKEALKAEFFWSIEDEASFLQLLDNLVGKLANISRECLARIALADPLPFPTRMPQDVQVEIENKWQEFFGGWVGFGA